MADHSRAPQERQELEGPLLREMQMAQTPSASGKGNGKDGKLVPRTRALERRKRRSSCLNRLQTAGDAAVQTVAAIIR